MSFEIPDNNPERLDDIPTLTEDSLAWAQMAIDESALALYNDALERLAQHKAIVDNPDSTTRDKLQAQGEIFNIMHELHGIDLLVDKATKKLNPDSV